jgi:hypothetical protein
MNERDSSKNTRSRRLPPLEAWKRPDKWMDVSTGLAKLDVPKLVFATDDRGFINPDEVVEQVEDMFFWKDYNWPFNVSDPETAPDDHHFYYTEAEYSPQQNSGSDIPSGFRELPTVIGRMPRQFHNVFHDLTVKPRMPDIEAMEEYHASYKLAHRAFKNLITSAKKTSQASHMFTLRQRALYEGKVMPSDPDDVVVKEMMRDFFSKHFAAYSRSIDEVMTLPERMLILPNMDGMHQHKPHLVMKKIGKFIVQNSINYTPVLRAS